MKLKKLIRTGILFLLVMVYVYVGYNIGFKHGQYNTAMKVGSDEYWCNKVNSTLNSTYDPLEKICLIDYNGDNCYKVKDTRVVICINATPEFYEKSLLWLAQGIKLEEYKNES